MSLLVESSGIFLLHLEIRYLFQDVMGDPLMSHQLV